MTATSPIYPVQLQPGVSFLRLPQILAFVPVGKSTWWRWVAEGKAPKPLKLGPKTTVWKSEDIAAFLEQLRKEG